MTRRQGVLLLLVALLAAVFWGFDLGHWLRLETLKAQQETLATLYAAHPLPVIAGYMALYVAVTALSLPGAVILTLAGGALFGLAAGTLIVSFASTAGASAGRASPPATCCATASPPASARGSTR